MKSAVSLYAQIYNIGVQNTLTYRWNFLLRAVLSFVPLLGGVFLWQAVLGKEGEINGYSYEMILSYFILMIILDAVASPTEDDFAIAADIREGRINQVLLKPLNYLTYRFTLFTASRTVYSLVAALPIFLGVLSLRSYLADIPWTTTLLPGILATIGSAVLQFMISYTVAMLAFWLLEVGSIIFIVYSIEFLAGGHMFPLDLWPPHLFALCQALPFAYEYWFPVAVMLGRIAPGELMIGFVMQWAWIGFFWLLSRVLWLRGLKRYTAVGG
jgi:ABC-2 type transport system permease protein